MKKNKNYGEHEVRYSTCKLINFINTTSFEKQKRKKKKKVTR